MKQPIRTYKYSIVLFSTIYIILIGAVVLYTWFTGKIVIGGTDGINQHYRAMVYISNLYRNVFYSIIKGEFSIPMYDYCIGMGEDILTTLNYYGLGDPFYCLLAFVPPFFLPYFYSLFFYLRLYIAGIAAIVFLNKVLPESGDSELRDISFIPDGTFVIKPHRLEDVLDIILDNDEAEYTDKREVMKILKSAVENGDNTDTQTEHVENIKDMLGNDRVLD